MTGILEVFVERGTEVGQDVILFLVSLSLLVDSHLGLLVGSAYLVQENVRDLTCSQPIYICLPLKNVDIANSIVLPWLVNG